MGDTQDEALRVDFDCQIKLEFHGSTVTSDAGLLAYRELDDALGLSSTAASRLYDARSGQNTQHSLLALLRQSICSRLAGYEDVNDAERLCLDPAMRIVVGGRAKNQTTASTSEMARFETETLSNKENLKHLMHLSGKWIDQAHQHRKLTKLILDMDRSVSETYGHQQGSAYNGHFACTCYHPLFLFNQFGDLERVLLRRGNCGSAKFWRRVLLPVIERYQGFDIPKFFRGDAAFAGPKLLRLLEKEGFRYAIRVKANAVLERKIAHLLRRPVGRPSPKPKVFYHSFRYRAGVRRARPQFYLSTEWSVPQGTVTIAIPFYLARRDLTDLHAERGGFVEGASRADLLRYLRHEMGHVINYAYQLYDRDDWVRHFGSFSQPYVEEYRPEPFSRPFVRHLPGWYAQKHPDEDWAETFAVWMTPGLDWRAEYAAWPEALAKFEYCDRTMRELADRDPTVISTELDEDVDELPYSREEYYSGGAAAEEFPPGLDGALRTIFEGLGEAEAGKAGRPASALIRRLARTLMTNVYRWTGHFPERTRALLRHLARRADELHQVYPEGAGTEAALALTTFVTALAMNYVYRGHYWQ